MQLVSKEISSNIEYLEVHRYSNYWIISLVLILSVAPFIIISYVWINQLLLIGESFSPLSNLTLTGLFLFSFIFTLIIVRIMAFMELSFFINDTGIHYKLQPFHSRFRLLEYNKIEKIEINKIKPALNFGRVRNKYKLPNSGKSYSINNKYGAYITMTDGKVILIGTDSSHAIDKSLSRYIPQKIQNNRLNKN